MLDFMAEHPFLTVILILVIGQFIYSMTALLKGKV